MPKGDTNHASHLSGTPANSAALALKAHLDRTSQCEYAVLIRDPTLTLQGELSAHVLWRDL